MLFLLFSVLMGVVVRREWGVKKKRRLLCGVVAAGWLFGCEAEKERGMV